MLIVAPLGYESSHGDCKIHPSSPSAQHSAPGQCMDFLIQEFNKAIVLSLSCLCFDGMKGSWESLGNARSLIAQLLVHSSTIRQGHIANIPGWGKLILFQKTFRDTSEVIISLRLHLANLWIRTSNVLTLSHIFALYSEALSTYQD